MEECEKEEWDSCNQVVPNFLLNKIDRFIQVLGKKCCLIFKSLSVKLMQKLNFCIFTLFLDRWSHVSDKQAEKFDRSIMVKKNASLAK